MIIFSLGAGLIQACDLIKAPYRMRVAFVAFFMMILSAIKIIFTL